MGSWNVVSEVIGGINGRKCDNCRVIVGAIS